MREILPELIFCGLTPAEAERLCRLVESEVAYEISVHQAEAAKAQADFDREFRAAIDQAFAGLPALLA